MLGDGNGTDGTVEAALVMAGGELGAFADSAVRDFSNVRVGYGTAGAANRLFAFGGFDSGAKANAISAAFESPAPGLQSGAWNSEGTFQMTTARSLMGSSIQSAFIFLIAGDTGAGVTTSTETVVW